MTGMKPRKGWIYLIHPQRVFLSCPSGHVHFYNLEKSEELRCQTLNCNMIPDTNQLLAGEQFYAFWTYGKFKQKAEVIQTFTAIALTAQEIYQGLPTIYPINPTTRNSLESKLYALTHQIITVDLTCLQDLSGNWLNRIGQIDKDDRTAIDTRLDYALDMEDNPHEDWFINHASGELLKKVFRW